MGAPGAPTGSTQRAPLRGARCVSAEAPDGIEAEGGWLPIASRGSLDGDQLGNLDAMIAALGWGAQLIAPEAADRQ